VFDVGKNDYSNFEILKMEVVIDKAGEKYWTELWEKEKLNPPVDARSKKISAYPSRVWHKIFCKMFAGKNTKSMKLLEIGCGNSAWLSYFAKEFGFEIYGMDYSSYGCEQAKKILQRDGVAGKIICADAFAENDENKLQFDVVCSFGVVEHFEDTTATIKSFSRYLKNGGILVTSVPNVCGLNGWMHKVMNRSVYDIHEQVDLNRLNNSLNEAGLEILFSKYYIITSLSVNLEGVKGKVTFYRIKKIISQCGTYFTRFLWWLEEHTFNFPQSRFFNAGILTFAKK
jgi:2-polyprenyl-3-methyl-5-hydroxy-6-metoxy-1,4-benzoquinol methylase